MEEMRNKDGDFGDRFRVATEEWIRIEGVVECRKNR